MMKQLKPWRFFAGLILFFAGLDVTLLLSHMSRLIGVVLIFTGSLLMISGHPMLYERTKDALPEKLVSFFDPKKLCKLRYTLLLLLVALSALAFYSPYYVLILVLILLIIPEILLRALKKENTDIVILSMEFQIFVFLSTLVYMNFDGIFGYRNPPAVFPLIFLAGAWCIEALYLHGHLKPTKPVKSVKHTEDEGPFLSERFIHFLTFKGRLKPLFPLFGIAIIAMVLVFNLFIRPGGFSLGSHDGVTLLLGIAVIAYNHIPDRYSFERDFTLLFLTFLFLILVLPITLITYTYGPMTEATNSPVVFHMLARPTAWLLRMVGIPTEAFISGPWVVIVMPMASESIHVDYVHRNVLIGLSCTGLYSVTIFISAFLSFVMVHFRKLDLKLLSFMGLGIFASWVANVLRMAIIMLMGHFYGIDAMTWTHNNAGIFIFMVWIALFWGVMFWYFDIPVRDIGGE